MGWFSQGKDTIGPTAAEAEQLWDAEAPERTPDSGVLVLEDAFQVAGSGVVFTGRVDAGSFRPGQQVIVQGRAGFARGTIGTISVGRDVVEEAVAGRYASFNVPNLSVRVEILDLDAGCTITGI